MASERFAHMWGEGQVAKAFALAVEISEEKPSGRQELAADTLARVVGAAIEEAFPLMAALGVKAEECVAVVAEEAREQAILLLGWEPRRKSIAPRVRTIIFRRDGYVCVDCGEEDVFKLSIDHRVPVHFGGSNDPSNLVTRCRSCNSEKGKGLRP